MTKPLTKEQKRKIYCVKHGHAKYITKCWGYVYCGRCGEQIGDQLASCFDTTKLLVVGCNKTPCFDCDPIRKSLNKMDLAILKELEAEMESELNE